VEERFGLHAQVRRASVSVASNIVEGCARSSDKDYRRFINVAFGSAAETHYLLTVIRRLELMPQLTAPLEEEYETLLRELNKLLSSIDEFE
jgi:four helix bundle protein